MALCVWNLLQIHAGEYNRPLSLNLTLSTFMQLCQMSVVLYVNYRLRCHYRNAHGQL